MSVEPLSLSERVARLEGAQRSCDERLDKIEERERAELERIQRLETQQTYLTGQFKSEKGNQNSVHVRMESERKAEDEKLHSRISNANKVHDDDKRDANTQRDFDKREIMSEITSIKLTLMKAAGGITVGFIFLQILLFAALRFFAGMDN